MLVVRSIIWIEIRRRASDLSVSSIGREIGDMPVVLRYRSKAAECERLASTARDHQVRQRLLELQRAYLEDAAAAEERRTQRQAPSKGLPVAEPDEGSSISKRARPSMPDESI
jgi:hypothetical protein